MKILLKISCLTTLFLLLVAAIMWLVGVSDFTNINLAVYWSVFITTVLLLINILFGFRQK